MIPVQQDIQIYHEKKSLSQGLEILTEPEQGKHEKRGKRVRCQGTFLPHIELQ